MTRMTRDKKRDKNTTNIRREEPRTQTTHPHPSLKRREEPRRLEERLG